MEKITLDMSYDYKGSMNCTVTLRKNAEDDTISIITSYGEVVAVCTSYSSYTNINKDTIEPLKKAIDLIEYALIRNIYKP